MGGNNTRKGETELGTLNLEKRRGGPGPGGCTD